MFPNIEVTCVGDELASVPELSFKDVGLTVPGRRGGPLLRLPCAKQPVKTILKGCTGQFPRGSVTALLGPSGAGKTSLLNVLMARISIASSSALSSAATSTQQRCTGSVYFRGQPVTRTLARKWFAFVCQGSEQVRSDFTVAEQLNLACKLQHREATKGERREFRDKLCLDLGIAHTLETRASKLSGGERRRLSVALALVARPAVLIMDEPTSGLDSEAAKKLVECVRLVSRERDTTVIMSVHQPSKEVFQNFDRVVFLSAAHVVFEGKRSAAPAWFRQLGFDVPESEAEGADVYLAIIDCPRPKDHATAGASKHKKDGDGESQPAQLEAGNIGSSKMLSLKVVQMCSERFRDFQLQRTEMMTVAASSSEGTNHYTPSPSPSPSPQPLTLKSPSRSTASSSCALELPAEVVPGATSSAPEKWLAPWPRQIPSLLLRELRFNYRNTASIGYYAPAAFVSLIFLGVIMSGATFEGDTMEYTLMASKQITKIASLVLIAFGTLPPLLVQEWEHHLQTTETSSKEIEDGRVSALALGLAEEIAYILILATTAVVSSMLPYYLTGLAGGVGSVAWGKFVLLMFLIVWDMHCVSKLFCWLRWHGVMQNFMLFCFVFLSGTYIPLMSVPVYLQWTRFVNPGAWVGQAMLVNELDYTNDRVQTEQAFAIFFEPSGIFTYELCALLMAIYGIVLVLARIVVMQVKRSSIR